MLSEVDPEGRTANCANCGPVGIVGSGTHRGQKQWKCKEAKRAWAKSDRRADWYKAWQKDYYNRTGGASQHKAWIKQYGLTPENYQQMLDKQEGKCAICKEKCSTGQRLSVDHCHTTGRVRGLLCRNCNRAIGLLKENREAILRAAEYLE